MKSEKLKKIRDVIMDDAIDFFDDPIRLFFTGFLGISSIAIIGSIAIAIEEEKYKNTAKPIETVMHAGEHIVSVPVRGTNTKKQYTYHEGYEVVGMNEKCILYVNCEDVTCEGIIYEDGKCIFESFGTPVELEEEDAKVYYIK